MSRILQSDAAVSAFAWTDEETIMPFYERGNVRIHYQKRGSGLPLPVIPGRGLNSTIVGLAS
jgi:hypothetical protein